MERSRNEIDRAAPIGIELAVTALATFTDFSRGGGTLANAVEWQRGFELFPGFDTARHGGGNKP